MPDEWLDKKHMSDNQRTNMSNKYTNQTNKLHVCWPEQLKLEIFLNKSGAQPIWKPHQIWKCYKTQFKMQNRLKTKRKQWLEHLVTTWQVKILRLLRIRFVNFMRRKWRRDKLNHFLLHLKTLEYIRNNYHENIVDRLEEEKLLVQFILDSI